MGGYGPAAKHLPVDSLEPSEDDQEKEPVPQLLPEMPMAHHPTKVVVHPELADLGDTEEEMELDEIRDAGEEMPLPHMTGNVMEGTKAISMQESVVWEAWHGWEESLREAHRMWRVALAALHDELKLES